MSKISRRSDCRYCERYGRACGRPHSDSSRGDWGRDWRGYDRPVDDGYLNVACPSRHCDAGIGQPCFDDGRVHAMRIQSWQASPEAAAQFRAELAAAGAVVVPSLNS